MFVYHFVDPDLRVETFLKKVETAENGGVDFEIRDIGILVLKVEENFIQSLCALLLFFGDYLFKTLLTCTFIPLLLSSGSRKKYTLRLFLTCLEAPEEEFSCFPERDWEGVSRDLLSLVKLYQRI